MLWVGGQSGAGGRSTRRYKGATPRGGGAAATTPGEPRDHNTARSPLPLAKRRRMGGAKRWRMLGGRRGSIHENGEKAGSHVVAAHLHEPRGRAAAGTPPPISIRTPTHSTSRVVDSLYFLKELNINIIFFKQKWLKARSSPPSPPSAPLRGVRCRAHLYYHL